MVTFVVVRRSIHHQPSPSPHTQLQHSQDDRQLSNRDSLKSTSYTSCSSGVKLMSCVIVFFSGSSSCRRGSHDDVNQKEVRKIQEGGGVLVLLCVTFGPSSTSSLARLRTSRATIVRSRSIPIARGKGSRLNNITSFTTPCHFTFSLYSVLPSTMVIKWCQL